MKTAEEVYLEHTGWESMEDIEDYDSPEDIILLMEKHAQQRVNEVLDKAYKNIYMQDVFFEKLNLEDLKTLKNEILKLKNK